MRFFDFEFVIYVPELYVLSILLTFYVLLFTLFVRMTSLSYNEFIFDTKRVKYFRE